MQGVDEFEAMDDGTCDGTGTDLEGTESHLSTPAASAVVAIKPAAKGKGNMGQGARVVAAMAV